MKLPVFETFLQDLLYAVRSLWARPGFALVAVSTLALNVLRLILSRGALLTAVGIALGAAGALAAGRVLETLLFEVTPTDPATHIAVAATLGTVALLASLFPALRATRIDAIRALRTQ